jgi:hypothetical protein
MKKINNNEIMKILVCLYGAFYDEDFEEAREEFLGTFHRYRRFQETMENNYTRCHERLMLVDDIIKNLKTENEKLKEENVELKLIIKKMARE